MIDVIANEAHFVDHLAPVWEALPPEVRGTFYYRGAAVRRRGETVSVRDVPGMVRGIPPHSGNHTLTASVSDLGWAYRQGRRCAVMEHGAGQSYGGDGSRRPPHPSYAGGVSRPATLFLHPGDRPAARDRLAYPGARVEVVGCPKLDTLPRKPERSTPPVVAFGFHWDGHVYPETRSGWSDFAVPMTRLARSGSYQVLGHGHPRILPKLARWYERDGIETVATFDEVCARADLYVVDNSSTLYEFAATGRPVVVLNARYYRRNVDHGLRFWEASTVGVNVEAARRGKLGPSLEDAVAEALLDRPERRAAREAALDIVYAYRTDAARRAAAVLLDWAR